MTLRPKSIFFTLALIIGSQASFATPEVLPDSISGGAEAVAGYKPPSINVNDPARLDSSLGGPAANQAEFVQATKGSRIPAVDENALYTQCPFMNETLTPEFRRFIDSGMCLPTEETLGSYCDCLRRLMRTSRDFENTTKHQGQNLRRIGYQFMLQQWSDRFATQAMAFSAYASQDPASPPSSSQAFPASCEPKAVYGQLQANLEDDSCQATPESKAAFNQAINVILGTELGADTDFKKVVIENQISTRIYKYPENTTSLNPGQNHFVDCMPPEDKRAMSLIPISFNNLVANNGFGIDPNSLNRFRDFQEMKNDLEQWKNSVGEGGHPRDALRNIRSRYRVRSALTIFPGIETLMDVQDPQQFKSTIEKLIKFVDHLNSPVYRSMAKGKLPEIEKALKEMSTQAELVKSFVREQLAAAETSSKRPTDKLNENCEALQLELKQIACTKPDFILSQSFMQGAYDDARRRGTKSIPGQGVTPEYANCNPLSNPEDQLGSCMTYHAAQCSVGSGDGRGWANIIAPVLEPSTDIRSPKFRDYMARKVDNDTRVRINETDVVHGMCGHFNRYLREKACSSMQNDEYRQCIVNQSTDSAEYKAWKVENGIEDPFIAAWESAPSIGSRRPQDLFGRTPRNPKHSVEGNMTGTETTTNTAIIGASTLAGSPNTIGDAFRGATGSARNNMGNQGSTIIDIDSPAEIRSAIEQREQRVETKNTEIAQVDAQIADLGTDSESVRLRSELESLRAEMVAERDRNTREIAELRNRANNAEVVARDDSSNADDDEPVATTRRTDARNSGIVGGAGNAQAQGYNIGGRAPASAPETSISGDFTKASVATNFATAGATRGGLIQAAQSLPSVQSQDPNVRLSLRVGDASYPVSEVKSFELAEGVALIEENIINLIRAQSGQIPLDAQNRAFVEIRDKDSKNSVVVYVRINGSEIEFLDANEPQAEESGVRATLMQLESLLGAVRD